MEYIYILESNGEITWNNSCESVLSVFILSSLVYWRKWRSNPAAQLSQDLHHNFWHPQHCTTMHNPARCSLISLISLLVRSCTFMSHLVTSCRCLFLRRLVFAWRSAYSKSLFESHQPVSSLWQDCSSAHKHRLCPFLQGKCPRLVWKHAQTLLWFMYVCIKHQHITCSIPHHIRGQTHIQSEMFRRLSSFPVRFLGILGACESLVPLKTPSSVWIQKFRMIQTKFKHIQTVVTQENAPFTGLHVSDVPDK